MNIRALIKTVSAAGGALTLMFLPLRAASQAVPGYTRPQGAADDIGADEYVR